MKRVLRGLLVALAALVFAGCKDQACIQWSEADGACPTQNEAREFMVKACGEITSVDGDGSFGGNLCCYDVTKSSNTSSCPTTGGF